MVLTRTWLNTVCLLILTTVVGISSNPSLTILQTQEKKDHEWGHLMENLCLNPLKVLVNVRKMEDTRTVTNDYKASSREEHMVDKIITLDSAMTSKILSPIFPVHLL